MAALDPFFKPQRIALVGASERGMYPAGILRNLLDYGFQGQLYPVNPGRETVFGLPSYPDVTQTPEPADLAVLTVPRQAVLPVLRQCVQTGVRAAVIISAGFAEADDEGRRLQEEMAEFLQDKPLRVLGPNCAGLAHIPGRMIATRLPAPPRPGPISFVSQSGALMMALYGLFSDRMLGLDHLLSLGNQVDVTLADSLSYLVAAPQTQAIGAFVEGLGDGRPFVAALREALQAGKPLVLVKSGRTEVGRQAAATHTAALTGSDRAFQAVCDQFGVITVEDVGQMVDTLQVLAAFGPRLEGAQRLAIVTQSGGLGSLSADLAHRAGLTLPPYGQEVQNRLHQLPFLLSFGDLGNPADVRGASVIGPNTEQTLAPFMEDAATGAVLLLLAKSSVREEDAATAQAIVSVARRYEKPLFVVWVGQRQPVGDIEWQPAARILAEGGVPLFDQPSDCIRALSRAVAYWQYRRTWLREEGENGG